MLFVARRRLPSQMKAVFEELRGLPVKLRLCPCHASGLVNHQFWQAIVPGQVDSALAFDLPSLGHVNPRQRVNMHFAQPLGTRTWGPKEARCSSRAEASTICPKAAG